MGLAGAVADVMVASSDGASGDAALRSYCSAPGVPPSGSRGALLLEERRQIQGWDWQIWRGEEAAHADPVRSGLGSGDTVTGGRSRCGACGSGSGACGSGKE